MRISDWSSDVCSSDLATAASAGPPRLHDDLRHPHRLAGLADDGGRVLDAEGSGKPAFLVEVETALPRRHLLDRRTIHEDDLRLEIGIARCCPGELCGIVPIDEDEEIGRAACRERVGQYV